MQVVWSFNEHVQARFRFHFLRNIGEELTIWSSLALDSFSFEKNSKGKIWIALSLWTGWSEEDGGYGLKLFISFEEEQVFFVFG